ncbi:hypothetical protein N9W41_00010 [bacterium]|nr:hypothetical protein [bacterium]
MFLTACQTTPVNYSQKTQGYWKAKALVNDKKNNINHIVYLEINAIKNKKLRMDIISPLGGHLASIILNGKKASYLNMEKKIIYTGRASARALAKVASVPIDPKLFYNVVFDLPVKNKSWNCINDEAGNIKLCKGLKTGTTISWGRTTDAKKSVFVENRKVKLQINFRSYKSEVEARSNLFEFKKIPGFKNIRI